MRLIASALLAATFLASPAGATARYPDRLQVTAREFGFTLSRTSVRSGRVTIELVNFGEDDHDLALARTDGKSRYALPLTRPGARASVTVTLRKGTYRLACTIGDHALRGMKSSLRVR